MRTTNRLLIVPLLSVASLAACTNSTEPAVAARLVVDPGIVTLAPTGTQALTVRALDAEEQPITARIAWSTSDETVAEVSAAGAVTAKAPGIATITAAMDDARSELVVRVVPERLGVCERNNAVVCGTWVWDGNHYEGSWQDGATAVIRLETLSSTSVVFTRLDYGKNRDFSAVYTGTLNFPQKTGTGGVVWSISGTTVGGSWTAEW